MLYVSMLKLFASKLCDFCVHKCIVRVYVWTWTLTPPTDADWVPAERTDKHSFICKRQNIGNLIICKQCIKWITNNINLTVN